MIYDRSNPGARLLYVVAEDWYFLSHRLPMARAAIAAGFEVHVATRITTKGAAQIEAEGFVPHHIPFARGAMSPSASWTTIRALRALHNKINPDVVHHVALQCAVLGSVAALFRPVRIINALTGFGWVFTAKGAKAKALQSLSGKVLSLLINKFQAVALVQNPDDRTTLEKIGIRQDRIFLIPGSGVDIEAFQVSPEPPPPIVVTFVGRLLDDKGVRPLIAAHRMLRSRGSAIELLIAGSPDPANPTSISQDEVQSWSAIPGVTWLGEVTDIAALWQRSHIAVLPSRREGLPKSLLEAAACGRPMVATDVPGCREVVLAGRTGLLVFPDDPVALAEAIDTLTSSPELRQQFGQAARTLVEENFSAKIIGKRTIELYRNLLETSQRNKPAA